MAIGNIAPHEFRELDMVISGSKKFAVIEKRKNPDDYFAAGGIESPFVVVQYVENADGPEVIISRSRAAIAEYCDLLADGVSRLGIKDYHRAMGKLFGYSAADIETFIADNIDCNCAKCGGLQNVS
jgi:hypothetical protein